MFVRSCLSSGSLHRLFCAFFSMRSSQASLRCWMHLFKTYHLVLVRARRVNGTGGGIQLRRLMRSVISVGNLQYFVVYEVDL